MGSQAEEQLYGKDYWEDFYAQSERVWSGGVNSTLANILEPLPVGRSLDLGCGEGGDVLWLASRGWQATGVDISSTAIERAQKAATRLAPEAGSAEFLAADLDSWDDNRKFDLVTLSFFHAPFDMLRENVLRGALQRLAPSGDLVVLSHGSHPMSHGSEDHDHDAPQRRQMATVDSELKILGLPAEGFEIQQAYTVDREVTGPDGQKLELEDVVVIVRRTR